MAKWRKDSRPEEVANRLEAVKDRSVAGEAAFIGFEHSELVVVLGGMIEFDPTIPELERRKILSKATFEAGAKGNITSALLLQSCRKQETEYLRKPLAAFCLLTGLSLASVRNLPSVRIGSSVITFNPKAKVARQYREKLYSDARLSPPGTACGPAKARQPPR